MRDLKIRKVLIDPQVKDHPLVKRILERLDKIKIKFLSPREYLTYTENFSFDEAKRTLFLTTFQGRFVKRCPGTGKGYICCGYRIINQQINCPLDCSYCILQDYLGASPIIIYVNFGELKEQLEEYLRRYEGKLLRIGTGELTDSLALDYLGDFSTFFVLFFRKRKSVFEFKTKTDKIDKVLSLPVSENIVFSWSLNPEKLVKEEEHLTASLKKRLESAYVIQEKGFRLGFHFDPIIFYPGWEKEYERLIENLFSFIDPSRILWISLGALRFPPSLKKIIQKRFPSTKIIYEEMILGLDGKLRYIKPIRIKMFKKVYNLIKDVAPQIFCYLCMESPDVWEKVTGFSPRSSSHLEYLFHEYLRRHLFS